MYTIVVRSLCGRHQIDRVQDGQGGTARHEVIGSLGSLAVETTRDGRFVRVRDMHTQQITLPTGRIVLSIVFGFCLFSRNSFPRHVSSDNALNESGPSPALLEIL
jgi:hypothetical protein